MQTTELVKVNSVLQPILTHSKNDSLDHSHYMCKMQCQVVLPREGPMLGITECVPCMQEVPGLVPGIVI